MPHDGYERTGVTLLIDREIDEYLTRMATRLGRDRNDIANDALIEWLEDLEDIAEAECVLAEGNPTVPAEEVWKRPGLDD